MSDPVLDFERLFEASPGLFLVLDAGLKIVAVSDAYLKATMTKRAAIIGHGLFEVYQDNPGDHSATGVANLRYSLETVLATKAPHTMPIQRYDIRRAEAKGGGFEERFWSPINSPVVDSDGSVIWIVHRVEDVTEFVRLRRRLNLEPNGETGKVSADIFFLAQEVVAANEELRAVNREQRARHADTYLYLASIVESSNDAIIGRDAAGNITSWNQAADIIFGYSASEVIGLSIKFLLPPITAEGEAQRLIDRLHGGEDWGHFETLLRRKDGEIIAVSIVLSPIKNAAGQTIGTSKVVRDVTQKKHTERALAAAQLELERHAQQLEQLVDERTRQLDATVRELESFCYSLSHDMRAPLRAIQSYGQIIAEDAADRLQPDETANLQKMVAAAGRLDRLIQEVLVYSRLSKQEITPMVLNPKNLVREIVAERSELRPPAADVQFEGENESIVAHDASFVQCLSNLLENAAKFVAPGVKPVVRVRTERRANMIRIWVEDNGIGIDAAGQRRLFEMFQRINNPHDYEGAGIGLALVRKAAERMGGSAGVESELGKGSRFWIELPAVSP